MLRKLGLAVGLVAAVLFASAQSYSGAVKFGPRMEPDETGKTYHWGPYNATTGALFDAGYEKNSLGTSAYPASVQGGQALMDAECEARMLRDGVNNARSNIFSVGDDSSGRRTSRLVIASAVLDAGVVVTTSGGLLGLLYWRPLAGGDAGMPWVRVTTSTSGLTITAAPLAAAPSNGLGMAAVALGDVSSNAATSNADIQAPGYYCFIPVTTPSYGVSHIWLRLNRVFEPR